MITVSDYTNFASDTSILRYPDVFIYDAGAKSDTTPFLDGLIMLRKQERNMQSQMHLEPRLAQVNVGH